MRVDLSTDQTANQPPLYLAAVVTQVIDPFSLDTLIVDILSFQEVEAFWARALPRQPLADAMAAHQIMLIGFSILAKS